MRKLVLLAGLGALLLGPGTLYGQFALGAQGAWADNYDFGIGARAVVKLPVDPAPFAFVASFDWFNPEADDLDDYWEINANFVTTPALAIVTAYFGTGLNVSHVRGRGPLGGDLSDTRAGVNILGGLMYDAALLVPYAEARYEIEGGDQFVVTLGLAVRLTAATGIR